MDSLRKRRYDEQAGRLEAPSALARLRNMWQFASLCQWFYIFGGVVKMDNLDIDDLEMQCLSPHSTILQDMGLALLKYLSSHRGLTADLFDEYTRRQFAAKAPELPNPFGDDVVPASFTGFTVFQKIRILHQMTSFVMMNAEKLREKMAEQKDADHDQTTWRIEPFGWDRDDRAYFVLDDNRVYRLTEAVPLPPKTKKNTKKARAQARRSGKRRRISSTTFGNAAEGDEDSPGHQDEHDERTAADGKDEDIDDGLGGMTWECVAVTLDELRSLLASISSKKDPNERVLHGKIVEHLLPILEQQEERRKRREKERERELQNLAKMASAKRSSRIAGRQEQQKQEELQREEEQKRRLELDALRKQEQRQRKAEKEREARLFSREKRLHEREIRRAQHRDELAQLSEDSKSVDNAAARMSERRRQAEIEKNREALRELDDEVEEEWAFDCICGLHGKIDDGQHSVSCEKCNIWQHSKCLGIDEQEAEKDDFHFICNPCRRKAANAANGHTSARPVIRIKINSSTSDKTAGPSSHGAEAQAPAVIQSTLSKPLPVHTTEPNLVKKQESGKVKSDADRSAVAPPILVPPDMHNGGSTAPVKVDGSSSLLKVNANNNTNNDSNTTSDNSNSNGNSTTVSGLNRGPPPVQKGHENPFTVPHPGLSQPDQSPRKSHAYGTIHEQLDPVPMVPNDVLLQPVVQLSPLTPTATTAAGGTQLAPAPAHRTPTSLGTPRLQHGQGDRHATDPSMQSSPSLLPSRGGLSPIKHSPTVASGQPTVLPSSNPMSIILPPTAALSPSTPEQILMPPVKPEGLAHRRSFSNLAADLASQPHASER